MVSHPYTAGEWGNTSAVPVVALSPSQYTSVHTQKRKIILSTSYCHRSKSSLILARHDRTNWTGAASPSFPFDSYQTNGPDNSTDMLARFSLVVLTWKVTSQSGGTCSPHIPEPFASQDLLPSASHPRSVIELFQYFLPSSMQD